MMLINFFIVLIFLLIIALQFFLLGMNIYFNQINLLFVFVLFLLLDDVKKKWYWAVVFFFIIEIFSSLPHGVLFIISFFIAWIVYILGKNLLTNRSLYTVLFLVVLGSLFYKFLIILFLHILNLKYSSDNFLLILFLSIFWESIFIVFVYFLKNIFFGKKL